jgi:predicted nucleotidyltransferase
MGNAIFDKEKDTIALSLAGAYGSNLLSLFVYGSAATPDYRPGISDINLGIVLLQNDLENVERGAAVLETLSNQGVKAPFFFTRHYLLNSADVFPIEILNMKEEHIVIYGDDPLREVQITLPALRLQAERELKGKVLHLRTAYLSSLQRKDLAAPVLQASAREFFAIFKALVYLKTRKFPRTRDETIKQMWELFKMDAAVIIETIHGKARDQAEQKTIFKKYISTIDAISQSVDSMPLTPP